jgi:hypothetical protein
LKRPALLPGLILLGLGVYFLLKQLNIVEQGHILSWPLILIIIGLSFMICSFSGWDRMLILPGGILLALGVHFLGLHAWSFWPTHWSLFPGAVGIGFVLVYIRTKEVSFLIPAGVLLALPTVFYVFDGLHMLQEWWPVVLILVGVFLLFRRR